MVQKPSTNLLFLLSLSISILLFSAGCAQEGWDYEETISINDQINPLGITAREGVIWISAPKQRQVLAIDRKGNILKRFTDLQRPMHIHSGEGKVYIPIYLNDQLTVLDNNNLSDFDLKTLPDAPAGVFVKGDSMAIVDFYNHRIILENGGRTTTFGGKGHEKGQLFYPTDVEITDQNIFVADAYNNRVQIFDRNGNPLKIIGANDNINVATGITVYENRLFVTDFFNNKILVYDFDGNVQQELKKNFDKPADISVINGDLYIPNYGGTTITRYVRK